MSSNGKGDTLATETEHQLLELRLALETVKAERDRYKSTSKIFEKLLSHCVPTMKTKLCGMEGWTDIEESQDGIKMVKLLHRVYFDTDGSK